MSQEYGPWNTKSRHYRSSCSYLPDSTSLSNFGTPCTSKTAQPAPASNRRRTTLTFPGADPLHSAPTVASFTLTASVLSHDISNPSPKAHRLSMQPRIRTPSRIPTPTASIRSSTKCRAVSSPATASSKENVYPTTHRLLGPIPPGQLQNSTLTKSRTMNVLSSFASPFTRSTQSLTSSRASLSNLSAYNFNSNKPSSLPLPTLPTNIRQISTSMPTSYWLGRFQALHDRFRAENIDPGSLSSPTIGKWYNTLVDDATAVNHINNTGKSDEVLANKVFIHLESLCTNNEARKSLKVFQQAYARKIGCEALLPVGGTMTDSPSLIAKAGKLLGGGRKGNFGAGVLKKRSSMGMGLDNTIPPV